jgi:nucleotide exchange factor SIL1
MNLETGKNEGKLIDPKEKVENQGVVVDPQVEKATPNEKTPKIVMLSSDTKGAGSIVTTAQKVKDHVVPQDAEEIDEASPVQEPNWNHEKMYEVLQALPEPPQVEGMDLHDAHAKLSNAEFRKQMIKLWKKRQSDLKEAIESMQDDAKYFAELLEKFRKAENDPIEQMNVLEVLEYEVHDLDKAQVFNFIGGFQVVVEEALQASNYGVRSHAAWLIGSAVKNYKEAQEWALDAGALPKLIDCLKTRIEKETREEIIELKKKALYAIASLARSNERAQRLLLTNGGVKPLEEMMEEEYPLNLKFRVTLFVHDILSENLIDFKQEKMALEELQSLFRSSKWCQLTAQYFKQSKHVHREVLQALNFQVFSCIKEFTSLHLDQVLDAIISVWQNKAKQHPDEIEDDDLERIKVAQELLAHLNK